MKKLLLIVILFALFSLFPQASHAQGMMGGFQNPTPTTDITSSTAKDEAAGKAVWDKLQNKQVTCSQLTNDDFDVLGDFFMGNMIGSNHDSMNQMMVQRLGQDGEKKMHIALGERLSGCNSNATLPQGASYFTPMMGIGGSMMGNSRDNVFYASGPRGMMGYGNNFSTQLRFWVIGLVTWFALIIFLVLGSIYFLREIKRKK